MKKVTQFFLILLAVGAAGYWTWGRFVNPTPTIPVIETAPTNQPVSLQNTTPQTNSCVVVTYFTTNVRCHSCRTIESLARAAVEEGFAAELAAGTVRFQTINLDDPAHQHFAKDYAMSFKTVVVSREQPGQAHRWQKLDEVWSLLNQPEAFKACVANSVRSFLNPGK